MEFAIAVGVGALTVANGTVTRYNGVLPPSKTAKSELDRERNKLAQRAILISVLSLAGTLLNGGLQWYENHRNAKVQNRAWMQRLYVRLANPLSVSQQIAAQGFFMNQGRTPASNVSSKIWLALLTREQPLIFGPTLGDISKGLVGPQSPVTSPVVLTERATVEMISQLTNGALVLKAYGVIDYDDYYGDHHQYRWCSVYNQQNPNANENWSLCGEHNEDQ